MPPKAKRSTKKIKGIKKKAAAAVAANNNNNATAAANVNHSTNNDIVPPDVLNEKDDVNRILRWLKSARLDMKRMNKYMPATADDLRSGHCEPGALATALAGLAQKSGADDNHKDNEDMLLFMAQQLVERVLSSLPDDKHLDDDVEEYDEISTEMEDDLKQKVQNEFRRQKITQQHESETAVRALKIKLMKKALDSLCNSWASRLDDRFYQGRKGLFLQNCAVYHEDFDRVVAWLGRQARVNRIGIFEAKRLEHILREVASSISKGLDRETDTCWHCGTIRPDMQACEKCRVACFCSHECIEAAWPLWHKHRCRHIRDDYERYCDSIAEVDGAHVSGVLPCGFELRYEHDYGLATFIFTAPSVYQHRVRRKLNGPNMKYFYENLERVVRGEWWLWNSADDVQQEREDMYDIIAGLLAYDYFGYAEQYLNNGATLVPWNAMFEPEDLQADGFLESGPLMSAEYFLKRYSSANHLEDDATQKRPCLEGIKAVGWKMFRENYRTGGRTMNEED